jgi:N-acetylglucosaminyldiphosphoundecaprenol N-acetyl-beta-D-mannosaminyltransferase
MSSIFASVGLEGRSGNLDLTFPRVDLLGVNISAINMGQAVSAIEHWISEKQPHYVCVTSAAAVMDCYDQPRLKPIFNASGMTTPDGMAVVWWLRWHGQRQVERVYGPDLMLAVCQRSLETGWRHYFFGGGPGVAVDLARRLQARFPGLQVAGVCSPPFGPLSAEEDRAITEQIVTSKADIVWVGLGAPRQEIWMSDHVGRVGAPVLVGVGAAFDFLSGHKRQAPRWIQRSGFEWLFRLVSEPRRLWRRYLLGYPRFVALVTWQALRQTRTGHPGNEELRQSGNKQIGK